MMPLLPDSSAIEAAIMTVLRNDSTLHSLMPDGVFYEQAPPGSRAFVLVSLVDSIDVPAYAISGTRRAYEDVLYLIKATELSTSGAKVTDAAARIDTLLEDATFPIAGYGLMASFRVNRIRAIEVDDLDPDLRWQHGGGNYRVQAVLPH